MNILLVMVPLSIVLLIGAGIAFFWAVEHDQFDDMDTPALLPLLDLPFDENTSNESDDLARSKDAAEPVEDRAVDVRDLDSDL